MEDYQIRGLRGLYLRLIPPVFLLLLMATAGGTFIYLSLNPNSDMPPGNTRVNTILFGVGLLIFGAWGYHKHAKWIENYVWIYHYGDVIKGRLKFTRRYRETSHLTGNLTIQNLSECEDLIYRVQAMSPYMSMPAKKGEEYNVEVSIEHVSGRPIAVDSGEFLLWIVKSKRKKRKSA